MWVHVFYILELKTSIVSLFKVLDIRSVETNFERILQI